MFNSSDGACSITQLAVDGTAEHDNCKFTLTESSAPQTLEAIEYTRTDTIIKKACEFIKERFSFGDSWHTDNEATISDKVIEDFEKYIEE
jgi:hypothetical protein